MILLETLSHESFMPFAGKSFTAKNNIGEINLELARVTKLGHRRPNATRDPFSIVFSGPPELRLPQGIHHFSNPDFGSFELFITQISGGNHRSEFEAIFT